MTHLKVEGFGPLGEGNREGADVFTRLTTLSKDKGSADNPTSGLLLLALQQARLRTLFPSFWQQLEGGGNYQFKTELFLQGVVAAS